MKTFSIVLLMFGCAIPSFAQGTVGFANGSSSRVYNALTGTAAGNNIRVALYYAEDGVTNESAFVQIGLSVPLTSGVIIGGTRTVPTPVPGGWAMIQIRAFEAAYGATYEEAIAAPPQNGRFALRGSSNIL